MQRNTNRCKEIKKVRLHEKVRFRFRFLDSKSQLIMSQWKTLVLLNKKCFFVKIRVCLVKPMVWVIHRTGPPYHTRRGSGWQQLINYTKFRQINITNYMQQLRRMRLKSFFGVGLQYWLFRHAHTTPRNNMDCFMKQSIRRPSNRMRS